MTLKGREAELNEQKIGQAVFGRSPDYDSSIDGIVRTQASRLRQRLELYFEQEGAEEPVRVVIPKGGYIPVFTHRLTTEAIGTAPSPGLTATDTLPVIPPQTIPLRPRLHRAFPWVLCAVMAIALATVLIRSHSKTTDAPTVSTAHPLWSQIFVAQQAT